MSAPMPKSSEAANDVRVDDDELEAVWRLFVGVFPAPPVSEAMAQRISAWKAGIRERGVKWVDGPRLHATLCFLGSVPVETVPSLIASLRDVCRGRRPIPIELAGLGCFPIPRRPRVLWAGMGGDLEALASLQKAVRRACGPFVQKPDDKPFAPHLTLARVKDGNAEVAAELGRLLGVESATSFGSWTAVDFRLMRSELGGDRSRYDVVESFALGRTGR